MKILMPLCCVISLLLSQSAVNAEGLYKWKDARGNIQYGDQPPANVKAQQIELPKITIIDNYADQWKPMTFEKSQADNEPAKAASTVNTTYSKLVFLAPKQDQAIRANDGDVSAMVSLKPPLKKGHKLVFSIDGKAMDKTESRTHNFSGLSRGGHTIGVKVIDQNGKTIKSSSVGFNVLRVSALNQKQASKSVNKAPQAKSIKAAKQQQSLQQTSR